MLARSAGIGYDATVIDIGCGTGCVTEALIALVPGGRLTATDASAEMWRRPGDRAEAWVEDALDLDLNEAVDALISTATPHRVTDHDRLWARLARALRPGGVLQIQCGGVGNIKGVREAIDAAARALAPELVDWSPWVFAGSAQTERRLRDAGFTEIRCWLEERPTCPQDVEAFVRTSILAAHLERLPTERPELFVAAVTAKLSLPLGYVRLNASAVRA